MTIDGYIGGPNGEMDWMTLPWTKDIENYVDKIVSTSDCIILGRKLAEGFIPYWTSVAENPEHPEYSGGRQFADTPKVVFTQTLDESKWENTVLAKGDLVDEITKLKKQGGKDIYACGGAKFVSALIQHNLVDEYYLFVNPVAIGEGLTIFKEINSTKNLSFIESIAFDCGIVVLHYQPKREGATK